MRTVLNINCDWSFVKDLSQVPTVLPMNGDKVDLPHTWNAKDGQDGGNDYFRGTCCYAKSIIKSELPDAQRYYLEINGANSTADVYMNGKHLSHHDGGYSTWRVEITNTLREENCLSILVNNEANETVYPQTADFTFYGGIYRDVNIIAVPDTQFKLADWGTPGIHVTPIMNGKDAKVTIETYVAELQETDGLQYRVLDASGKVVAEKCVREANIEFVIYDAHLWDGVKNPYLYTAECVILRGNEEIDKVFARFGCRSFEINPEKGFILNGREYPLRGVARHQDRLGIGNALLPEHHREDMDLICEMGANTIRLAHYQHDQYFYDQVLWLCMPEWKQEMGNRMIILFYKTKPELWTERLQISICKR